MTVTQKKPTVLMVDDEVDFLDAAKTALTHRGLDVFRALNGAHAIEMIKQRLPDVIVLDVRMPDIDGVQLFFRLKLVYPSIPVILLTGHGTVQQAFETSRQGVFEYLTKPCDMDELARVIRAAHDSRRTGSQRAATGMGNPGGENGIPGKE